MRHGVVIEIVFMVSSISHSTLLSLRLHVGMPIIRCEIILCILASSANLYNNAIMIV